MWFCLFCINPTQAAEKAGVGEQRLFSLRHLPNILVQKWTWKAVIFVFHYFEVPCEKLHVTHYKSLLHAMFWPERLQLLLHKKRFPPPTLQEHRASLQSASCQTGHLAAWEAAARGTFFSGLTLIIPLARMLLATEQEMHPSAVVPCPEHALTG